jgi:kynureninase
VLDAFQSLGNVPLDVQSLNVDFATGGVLKWLCGGPGTAYLYVRPDLGVKLEPKITGWFAHQNPFGFEIGPTKYAEPPYRFMQGTSNVPGYYAALPGLKMIREIGVQRIREKSTRMTSRLIELADKRGWKVNVPRDAAKRGGTVAIDMANSRDVCQELLRRDVLVDFRPAAGVRFSPHFYNTMEEIDRAIATVDEILSKMGVAATAK